MTEEDLFFLEHVLWHDPTERAEVRATIHRLLRGYVDEAKALLYQTRELRDYAHRQWESNELRSRAVVEAHTKIRNILAKVRRILDDARGAGRPVEPVEAVRVGDRDDPAADAGGAVSSHDVSEPLAALAPMTSAHWDRSSDCATTANACRATPRPPTRRSLPVAALQARAAPSCCRTSTAFCSISSRCSSR